MCIHIYIYIYIYTYTIYIYISFCTVVATARPFVRIDCMGGGCLSDSQQTTSHHAREVKV